jgi:ABC-type branched-subunit amino acid transport system substrate-binding protein
MGVRKQTMARRAGPAAVIVAMLLLFAGCTVRRAGDCLSSPAAGKATAAAVPAQGVTRRTVTLSMLAVDLNILARQGLAPNIGNPAKVAQATVDDINARGGINGRKVVLKVHLLDATSALINPSGGQADCISATEQDKPLAVLIAAALPSALVRCVSVTHPDVAMTMNQWDDSLYSASAGRLFSCCSNTSIGVNRVFSAWPGLLEQAGGLHRGDKVGIISQQPGGIANDVRGALQTALVPSLKRSGFDVAAQAELPCPESSQTCTQQAAAVQRMKDSGVKVVFLTAQDLAGAATVAAAKNIDYHPTWATYGDNVTDTVAHFYAASKQAYDGAYGISTAFSPPTAAAAACNRIAARAGIRFPLGSDGYGFTAVTCLQVQLLAQAIGSIPGTITQDNLISSLEATRHIPTAHGPMGSFGPGKHDAGNAVFMARYRAADEKFIPIGGRPVAQMVP